MSGEDINSDTLSLPTIGNRIPGEYIEIKYEDRNNSSVKEAYLEVLCSQYQKYRKNIYPQDFYYQRISEYPKVGEIVSVEDFLAKLFE